MAAVGTSVPKYDGVSHVTGRTPFVDDVYIPGTLICKGFRSPVSHGTIRSLDVSEAEKLPGVAAVATWKDVPYNYMDVDWPVFAEKELNFQGQLIAAVAAVDEDTAQKAVSLIRADIEELPPLFDPRKAEDPDAPQIKPNGNMLDFGGGKTECVIELGDVEKGFAMADRIITHEYFYPEAEHAQLETQTSLAVPRADGGLDVYTCTQDLHLNLGSLSAILQMPLSKLNFVGGIVGGGFGGKNDLHVDPITAVLALKTGRPVKWRFTREEEMGCSTVRGAWFMKITDGVMNDGRIVARQMEELQDGGAYMALNLYCATKHAYYCVGPYYIPNTKVIVRCAFTNKAPSSSMRGFGVTACSFATEMQIQRLAEELRIDPFEIRLKNALRTGEPSHTGSIPDVAAAIEVLQKLAEISGRPLCETYTKLRSGDRRTGI